MPKVKLVTRLNKSKRVYIGRKPKTIPKATVKRLTRKINKVARMAQGESKYVDIEPHDSEVSGFTVAQAFGTGTGGYADAGYRVFDITPKPSSGTGPDERVGDTIRLKSMLFRFQCEQQKALSAAQYIKIYIARVIRSPLDPNSIGTMTRFLLPDLMSGCTDYNSVRNPSFYRNFRVLATKTIRIAPDTIRTEATGGLMSQIAGGKIYRKMFGTVKWDDLDPGEISDGQILMFVVASTGNSGSDITVTDQFQQFNPQGSSGANCACTIRWYYTDN